MATARRATVVDGMFGESKEERHDREMGSLRKKLGREVRTRVHSKTGTLAELEMTHPEWFVPEVERTKGEVEEEVDWMTQHKGALGGKRISFIGMRSHVDGEGWWNEGDLPADVVMRTVLKKESAFDKSQAEFMERIDAEERENAKLNPARKMVRPGPPPPPRMTLIDRMEQSSRNPLNARLRSAQFPKDFLKLSSQRVTMVRGGSTVDEATRQICPEDRLPELNASHVVNGRSSPAPFASTPGLLSRSSSRLSQRSASATPSRMSQQSASVIKQSAASSPAYSDGGSTPGNYSTPGGWSVSSGYSNGGGANGVKSPVLHLRGPRLLTASPSSEPKGSPSDQSARRDRIASAGPSVPSTSRKTIPAAARWGMAKVVASKKLEEEAERKALEERQMRKKALLAARLPDQVVGEALADFREAKSRISTELKDQLLRREVFVETAGPGLRGAVTRKLERRLKSHSICMGKDVQRLSRCRSPFVEVEEASKSPEARDIEHKYSTLCEFVESNPEEHWSDPDEVAVVEACKALLESGTGFTEQLFVQLVGDESLARRDGARPLEDKPRLCMLVHQIRYLCGVNDLRDAHLMAEEAGTVLPTSVEHIDPDADEHKGKYADILRLTKQFPEMAQGLRWITAASAVYKMANRSNSTNKINGVRLDFLRTLD